MRATVPCQCYATFCAVRATRCERNETEERKKGEMKSRVAIPRNARYENKILVKIRQETHIVNYE